MTSGSLLPLAEIMTLYVPSSALPAAFDPQPDDAIAQ